MAMILVFSILLYDDCYLAFFYTQVEKKRESIARMHQLNFYFCIMDGFPEAELAFLSATNKQLISSSSE